MTLKVGSENKEYWQLTWLRFKEGDKEAFAIFYNLHIDRLYQYGHKFSNDDDTIKDAIQEVFLEFYMKRASHQTAPENLKFYLLLVLKRNLIKKLKTKKRFERWEKSDGKFPDLEFSPEYQMIEMEKDEETRYIVVEALKLLSDKQKEVVYLRFNESMDYPEIANLLGINIESVRKQVYRALKTVRKLLDNKSFTILFYFLRKNIKKAVHV